MRNSVFSVISLVCLAFALSFMSCKNNNSNPIAKEAYYKEVQDKVNQLVEKYPRKDILEGKFGFAKELTDSCIRVFSEKYPEKQDEVIIAVEQTLKEKGIPFEAVRNAYMVPATNDTTEIRAAETDSSIHSGAMERK